MKRITIIFNIIILSLSIVSCKKYLDRPPLDQLSDQTLSFSKVEMELYCNNFYQNFPNLSGWAWEADGGSDNMVPATFDRWNSLLAGTVTVPASGGGWNFDQIRSVNFFIENYTKSKEPIALQKKYLGEIYFWKAYAYFNLLKQFGDLPWYTHTLQTNSVELYAPRVSRSIIADSLLHILDLSISYLPIKAETDIGRLHKDVALLFKSRIALYEGSWEKYHANDAFKGDGRDFNRFFVQAADASSSIIKDKRYKIYTTFTDPLWPSGYSYWSLFSSSTLINNPEVLLSREYSIKQNMSHWGDQVRSTGGMDGNGLSKSLMDSYLCTDGKPIGVSSSYQGDESILNLIKNRDTRIWQTTCWPGCVYEYKDNVVTKFALPLLTLNPWPNTTGYQQYKWEVPVIPSENSSGTQAVTAIPLYRYAEVLLIYAEARAELGTCTQEVLDESINLLRDRADMPHLSVNVGFTDPNWDYPGVSPLINEIRRERRVELALEGFRVDDLLRWAATDIIKKPLLGSKYAQWVGKPFSPALSGIPVNADGYIAPYLNKLGNAGRPFDASKNYLYPLPTSELVKNTSLKQNPGY